MILTILAVILYTAVIYLWAAVIIFTLCFKTKEANLQVRTINASLLAGGAIWLISHLPVS